MFSRVKIDRFFFRRKQIEQKRAESGIVQGARDKLIPRTMPAASATVREKHQRLRLIDNGQISIKRRATGRNTHFVHRYTLNGYVSGNSPLSQTLARSSGSTADVSSM